MTKKPVVTRKPASIRHLKWLIASRGKNNVTSLKLLSLFEKYRSLIRKSPHAWYAQKLVAIAFSLWRAAFLSETEGKVAMKAIDAERFLRKMLTDNAIGFAQDMELREWSVNYYIWDAQFRLDELSWRLKDKKLRDLSPPKGKRHAKGRWDLAHAAFDIAVDHFERRLKAAKSKQNSKRAATS